MRSRHARFEKQNLSEPQHVSNLPDQQKCPTCTGQKIEVEGFVWCPRCGQDPREVNRDLKPKIVPIGEVGEAAKVQTWADCATALNRLKREDRHHVLNSLLEFFNYTNRPGDKA